MAGPHPVWRTTEWHRHTVGDPAECGSTKCISIGTTNGYHHTSHHSMQHQHVEVWNLKARLPVVGDHLWTDLRPRISTSASRLTIARSEPLRFHTWPDRNKRPRSELYPDHGQGRVYLSETGVTIIGGTFSEYLLMKCFHSGAVVKCHACSQVHHVKVR